MTQENPSQLIPEVQSLLSSQKISCVLQGAESYKLKCSRLNLKFEISFDDLGFVPGFFVCKIKYPKDIKPENTEWIKTMEIGIQNLLAV